MLSVYSFEIPLDGCLFLRTQSSEQIKLRTRRIGRLERNLSTPVTRIYRFKFSVITRIFYLPY